MTSSEVTLSDYGVHLPATSVPPTATFTATLVGPSSTLTRTNTPTPTRTATPTATSAGGGTTVTRQISAGSDHVNEDGTTYTETDASIFVGTGSSTTASFTDLHFTGVNVPKNATITSAYL